MAFVIVWWMVHIFMLVATMDLLTAELIFTGRCFIWSVDLNDGKTSDIATWPRYMILLAENAIEWDEWMCICAAGPATSNGSTCWQNADFILKRSLISWGEQCIHNSWMCSWLAIVAVKRLRTLTCSMMFSCCLVVSLDNKHLVAVGGQ